MFVDEQLFRGANSSLNDKREALANIYSVEFYKPYESNGIGGGYG